MTSPTRSPSSAASTSATPCDLGPDSVPSRRAQVPCPLGPDPVLLSRKEVDALYETLAAVKRALHQLGVDYVVTGGSLLGAIRQHSILFCDDDVDVAVIEEEAEDDQEHQEEQEGGSNKIESDGGGTMARKNVYGTVVVPRLQQCLGDDYVYQIKPWEGGDRVRPKRMNNVFLDLFVLRKYRSVQDLVKVIGKKKNGLDQPQAYVESILQKIQQSAFIQGEKEPLWPCWHFATRKAVEMWPKEVYRQSELFPLQTNLKMGPVTNINGPRKPVRLLRRAFGSDCFQVYYQSASHKGGNKAQAHPLPLGCKETVHDKGPAQAQSYNNDAQESVAYTAPVEEKSGDSINQQRESRIHTHGTHQLPPLVSAGGTWEGGQKQFLHDEHYLPIQPISRAARRPTLHCRERFLEYLELQTKLEQEDDNDTDGRDIVPNQGQYIGVESTKFTESTPKRTIYMDGVFDLFHIGHLEAIKQCAKLGNRVIIGVTGDIDATGYKRPPIVPEKERVAIIQALKLVDHVVCPCPLVVTEEFMQLQGIDLVVHGYANDADAERQKHFFEIAMNLGKFQRIPYYNGISTTKRIQSIQSLTEKEANLSKESKIHIQSIQTLAKQNVKAPVQSEKPQWFGRTLAVATANAPNIPYDPFPISLRQTIEPHIQKARQKRKEALSAIKEATGTEEYDATLNAFKTHLAGEGQLYSSKVVDLRATLIKCMGLPKTFDLTSIHDTPGVKDKALYQLTRDYLAFQNAYDEFMRTVCVPVMAAKYSCEDVYYQAFPCLRIIQPNEFSIGPHADVAHGHHPCSVNFYMPLTKIGGSSALFLESRSGSEDWHPIEGDIGHIKYFSGATCLHWTTENKTDQTRVSLDFRLIAGPMFHALKCGGDLPGGKPDVYRRSDGYYSICTRDSSGKKWNRKGSLLLPDSRDGFPWTVKDWDKFLKEHNNQLFPECNTA